MWTRRCPHRTILLTLVFVLTAPELTIGAKPSPSLDIQVKWTSDEASHVDITICVPLPEEEVNPTDVYFMTLSDYNGTTIREDKSESPNGKDQCFKFLAEKTKFDMEEYVDVFLYRAKSNENKENRRYVVISENINLIVPKVNAIDGNLVLVEWNNPDHQLFTLSYDADESSPMLCSSQTCQFMLKNSKHQKYMNFVIKSENKESLKQKIEIGVDMEIESDFRKELTRINFIRQSINMTDGDPYLTIEIEAPGLPPTECFWVNIVMSEHQQSQVIYNEWNGEKVPIIIAHTVLPVELENIIITVIALDNEENPVDVSKIEFGTYAFDTAIAIAGSDSEDNNAFLRVQVGSDEADQHVGDETCSAGSTCYYPYTEQNIEERVKEIKVDGNDDIKQYDDSIMPIINFDDLSEVTLVNEMRLGIAADYNASTNSIEAIIYDPNNINNFTGGIECLRDDEKDSIISCDLDFNLDMTNLEQLNIIIMILDTNGKVLESTLVVLKDLKIKLEMFTSSSLKVTWNRNAEDQYLLDIDPVSSSYKSISTSCKSALVNCLAFFTDVDAGDKNYTLSVKEIGSKAKFIQTITTTVISDPPAVAITKVIESNDGTKLEMDLSQLTDVDHVEVAVTRLNDTDVAIQTLIGAQKIQYANIYTSQFPTNPKDEDAFNNETELIILGYDAENEVVVTSYLNYQYADILLDFASVGNSAGSKGSSLRVASLTEGQDLYVGPSTCPYGEACYFIEPNSEALEICTDGVNNKDTQFMLCDETQEPLDFQEINEISNLILTDESHLEVSGNFNSSKESIEILLYDPTNSSINDGTQLCVNTDIKSTCALDLKSPVPNDLILFNILIAVIDSDQRVIESLLQPFEDLKLHSCLLTDDSFEAIWNQNDLKDEYNVSVTPELIYSSLPGICPENDTCKAFFIFDDQIEYTLLLQQKDDIRRFATTLNVAEHIGDIPPQIKIHKLIKSAESTKIVVAKEGTTGLAALDVSITTDVDVQPIQTYYTAEKISEDQDNILFSVPFVITPEERSNGELELILIGKDKNYNILASASIIYQYKEISIDITSVGNDTASDGWSVRVAGLKENQNLLIGNKTCSFKNQPCYIIEPQESTQEVCEEVDYNDNMVFFQCDETLSMAPFKENENISQVILNDEEEMVITSNEDLEVKSAEIYLYYADDVNTDMGVSKCENPKSCSISTDIPETEYLLKILVVSLDGEKDVLKSSLISFEDLKLNVTNLTPEILAVNWHHGVMADNYQVHLKSEDLYFMSSVESSCENYATCAATFSINTDPEHQYTVTIQKGNDDLTKMSKSYTTSDDIKTPEVIHITNIIESEGFTKITLKKSNLPPSLEKLGVSITSKGVQTFVPASNISETDNSVVYSIPFVFSSSEKRQNTDDTEMVLVGLDKQEKVIASAEINFQYQELSTKISPVGAPLNNASHSIRVVLGEGEDLQNTDYNCTIGSPCYLIEPNTSISACGGKQDGNEFELCDEASSDFKEISAEVTVSISTEGVVHVKTILPESDLTLEVVVYKEKYPHDIVSKSDKYKCTVDKVRDEYSCTQDIQDTKDFERALVLVVAIDSDNSVVQSKMVNVPFNRGTDVETWVIVVSCIGGLFGLIFIIGGVVVTWKKMNTKKLEKEFISQIQNKRTENNSNLQNEDEDHDGEDLPRSHLRSQEYYEQENGHANPSFDDSRNNVSNIAQNTHNYRPQNNTHIVNNTIHIPNVESYAPDNVTKRISRPSEELRPHDNLRPYEVSRPYGVSRPKHPYPNAGQKSPPPLHGNFRHSNSYDSPVDSDYSLPYKHPNKTKEPTYARLSKDNATQKALEPIPLAPIPRISLHPSRAQQYKAIKETTTIPPQGRWDVDV